MKLVGFVWRVFFGLIDLACIYICDTSFITFYISLIIFHTILIRNSPRFQG